MPPKLNFHVLPRTRSKPPKKLNITYKFQTTKFGNVLIGYFQDKICHVSFQDGNEPNFGGINEDFPQCVLTESTDVPKSDLFDDGLQSVDVLLAGTEFQVKVWKQLANIDRGNTVSYERIAEDMGNFKAVRSVANAIAKNKIAYIIPCHRVINKNGRINKYRWGVERKKMLLDYDKNITL